MCVFAGIVQEATASRRSGASASARNWNLCSYCMCACHKYIWAEAVQSRKGFVYSFDLNHIDLICVLQTFECSTIVRLLLRRQACVSHSRVISHTIAFVPTCCLSPLKPPNCISTDRLFKLIELFTRNPREWLNANELQVRARGRNVQTPSVGHPLHGAQDLIRNIRLVISTWLIDNLSK